jgi:hypothetical protein
MVWSDLMLVDVTTTAIGFYLDNMQILRHMKADFENLHFRHAISL